MLHLSPARLVAFTASLVTALAGVLAPLAAQRSASASPEPFAAERAAVSAELCTALVRRNWSEALALIEASAASRPEDADFWAYLRGSALAEQGQVAAAIEVLLELERAHPQSAWRTKARFRRAELLRASGDLQAAQALWEEEAERLSSQARKGELADIYLDFAGRLSTPAEQAGPEPQALDYARARALYQEVLELEAPSAARDLALFRIGVCLAALGDEHGAIAAFETYLAALDPWRVRGVLREPPGEHVFAARLELGRARVRSGDLATARRTFEDIVADGALALAGQAPAPHADAWRADPERARALERLRGDAALAVATTWSAASALEAPFAVAALERFLADFPGHPGVVRAAFEVAERLEGAGRGADALAAYEAFLAREPAPGASADERDEAARLARTALYAKGRVLFAQREYERAIAVWNEYVGRYPTGAEWSAAQLGVVEAEYEIGVRHAERGEYAAARAAWQHFIAAHPLHERAASVQYEIGQLFADEAGELPAGAAEPRAALFRQAIAHWRELAARWGASDAASRALLSIGWTHEMELGEPEQAVAAYRSCDFGPYAGRARERLEVMTRPALALATERTWRSGESVKVELEARNVERVSVNVYALDLEAYFRKHHTHQRVEDLDIDLIAADRSFEVVFDDYGPYRPLARSIELPVEGPGVWAVAVSSADRRATTLAIRSDVDVIVKSSRREVFVFAEDMRALEPAAGTSVLVAIAGPAGTSLRELVTGADGVARLVADELAASEGVHVFAARGAHCASNGLALGSLALSPGPVARGWVTTDRPAYRPGATVHWRAIVRGVRDGRYFVAAGESEHVQIVDARGRALSRATLELSPFGTLAGEFTLPADAALGTYAVLGETPGGTTFRGSFEVAAYEVEKVELVFEPERDVWFRGEEVAIAVVARHYYGEPLAGAPLAVGLPDGSELALHTDLRGRAEFRFPTRDYPSAGALGFRARLTEEGVEAAGSIHLAVQGFVLEVETAQDTLLAGDSFEVSATARTPSGAPAAEQALELEVLRREAARDGGQSERKVSSFALVTDAAGRARRMLALEQGGTYVLRAAGRDRFGNPVQAERVVFVSGEDDEVRLRFFVDSERLKVGATARATLHDRAEPGLALLTWEAEGVLAYRIARIERGANPVEFAVGPEHAPGVRLAAAMMTGNELHVAEVEFAVERALSIAILPGDAAGTPGGQAAVELVATDASGRPVSAELSLAVVDAALFALYPDASTPALAGFFEAGARQAGAMQTIATCTFRYAGATRAIAAEVLEEARRESEREAWVAAREELGQDLRSRSGAGPSSPGSGGGPSGPSGPGRSSPGSYRGPGDSGPASAKTASDDFFLGRLDEDGRPRLRERFEDTAFWSAAIVTGEDGRAQVAFPWPDQATRWRFTAVGVDQAGLFGTQTAEQITRAEFFVELRHPSRLVEGDAPRFVVRVHNATGFAGRVDVRLRAEGPGVERELSARLSLAGEAVVEHTFEALAPLSLGAAGAARAALALEVEAAAELGGRALADRMRAEIPVEPFGLELEDAASARLGGATTLWLELPEDRAARARVLELHVGPSRHGALLAAALGQTPIARTCPAIRERAAVATELIGVCAVLDWFARTGSEVSVRAELQERGAGLVAELVAAQADDGTWTWIGPSGTSPESSAYALAALARARSAGFHVPPQTLESGLAQIEEAFRRAEQEADELKALLLWAQAELGRGDFGAANRLHRERAGLSSPALAFSALALAAMQRGPMAREVAETLEARAAELPLEIGTGAGLCWRDAQTGWNSGSLELTAWAVLALETARPESARIAAGVAWLESQAPWWPARARGVVLAALALHESAVRPSAERAEIVLRVNGAEVGRHAFGGGLAESFELSVPIPDAAERRVRVDVELSGRGAPELVARLSGFTSDVAPLQGARFEIAQNLLLAAEPRYRGRKVPTGFDVLKKNRERAWQNGVSHLARGQSALARIDWSADWQQELSAADYFVLEVPLPAGARVVAESLRGSFASYSVTPQRLVVNLGQQRGNGRIEFELVGVLPGRWRALPPVLTSLYRPAERASAAPVELSVLDRGEPNPDPYRATPSELFALGGMHFADDSSDEAQRLLGQLWSEYRDLLTDQALRETARMLLFLGIARGDSRAVVESFEVLREKDPNLVIPFAHMRAIGAAYRDLGEFERALLIFRATIEETFGKDLKVAGALEQQGEFAGASDVIARLWSEFPDLPAVVETHLALSEKLLAKAPEAARDASLVRAERDRKHLTGQGIRGLVQFLALYPSDPRAPEAGLDLVGAYLALEDFARAAELAETLAGAHVEPRFADAFQHSRAVAEWYLGHADVAVDLLEGIAQATYADELGRQNPSANRDLALYILGQIHHARQDVAHASEYYERVADLFADAREALEGFRAKSIALPEVSEARPGESASLVLEHKGVAEVELLAYRVDLMTLALRERNLADVARINLAGIAPALRRTLELELGSALRTAETRFELELPEPGAYLLICRGGEQFASGLVLVSELALSVEEQAGSGYVRIQAWKKGGGELLADVDVRAIGSRNASFVSGRTDRRGLLVAEGLSGTSTVIARLGEDSYAFHRGAAELGEVARREADRPGAGQALEQADYLQNVLDFNTENQRTRAQWLEDEIQRERAGLRIEQVK